MASPGAATVGSGGLPGERGASGDGPGDRAAALWALVGSGLVFLQAVVALGARGVATVRAGLEPTEWWALGVLTAAFVYGEGILALERRFIPALVRRAGRLRTVRHTGMRLLAPLYAFSLVGAPLATLVRAWAGVAAIVVAVVAVRALPEPWRGIVDLAVAAALAWALVALVRQGGKALR